MVLDNQLRDSTVGKAYYTPPIIKAIALALGCLPELEAKSPLLKTQCISDPGLKGPELNLTPKPFPRELEFIEPEGAMQANKGRKHPTMLPTHEAYAPHSDRHGNRSPMVQ